MFNGMYMCGCTVNNIGHVGAQSIGDGLKSLTSLTTLDLNGEWCVMLYYIVVSRVDGMCVWLCVECTGNSIGHVGAQYIGDSLKSITSLTTLNLNGEWCVMLDHIVVCVCLFSVDGMCLFVCWDVQVTTLDTLEHNPLVMVSSHLHHLQHWIWVVGDGWCVCVDLVLMECVCLCVLDVQWTRLGTLEHNALVIVSSHSHLLQHWIWEVSNGWCVKLLYVYVLCWSNV